MAMASEFAAACERVYAVASLAFRASVRSRLLVCMALLLLFVTFGLPLTMSGDGTFSGYVRVLLNYSLGLSTLLLGIAMLWTSCAGISKEIELGHLRLMTVRPVRPIEIWLGKWLGLVALSTVLLATAGVGTAGLLQWRLHATDAPAEDLRVAREQILLGQLSLRPPPDDVEADAIARLDEYAAQGLTPDRLPRAKALELARREIRAERVTVAPGASRTWRIPVSPQAPAAAPMVLRIRVSPASGDTTALAGGTWRMASEGAAADAWTPPRVDYRHGVAHIPLPDSLVRPGQSLLLTFTNVEGGGTVVFDFNRGVELLIRASGFGSNLLRALLVVWCRLALLCALGLAAGTFFSFPVATFVASSLVLLCLTGNYFVSNEMQDVVLRDTAEPLAATVLQDVSETLIRALERVAAPAVRQAPLADISDGLLVSWGHAAQNLCLLVGLYGGLLAVTSAALLRRRELAAGSR